MLSLRRALGGEKGLSLLEVMVATSLVLGSLFATVSAMDSGTQAAAAAEQRVQATVLAERDLERLRSLPYHRIGLLRDGPGWTPTFDGATSVAVDLPGLDPSSVIDVSGTAFTLTRHVTWADVDSALGAPLLGAYKRLAVEVSWPGAEGGSVRLDSAVSPYFQADVCAQRWVDASTQSLAGVVNAYLPGAAASPVGADELEVGAAQGAGVVGVGDVVLVVQMEGADAGTYEYALATSAPAAGRLSVTGLGVNGGLIHAYGTTGRFQVVRVVNAARVTIAGTVNALPWNGTVGGVVAIDATEDLAFDAPIIGSDAGLDLNPPAGYVAGPGRLLPGGRAGVPGGALVMVRAAHLSGQGLIISSGLGGGGAVALLTETGGLEQMTVAARGLGLGGGPGALLTSSPPLGLDVSGPLGEPGVVSTDLLPSALSGVPLAAGCLPAVGTTAAATRSGAPGSGTVTYTVTVSNRASRGTASGLTVDVALPEGVEFRSGDVQLSGGATRGAIQSPSPGAGSPSWGDFTLPAGGQVVITFVGEAGVDLSPDSSEAVVRVRYVGTSGPMVSVGRGGTLEGWPFSCPAPETDPLPSAPISGVLNAYFPLAATAPRGATMVAVGAQSGAPTPLSPGDLVLVIQSLDADGAHEGAYEYATVVAVASGQIRINGYGPGGGLINEYRSPSGDSMRRAQLVRVPTYRSAGLGSVVAGAWDGRSGGLVAIDVAGELDLAGGSIDVDGAGSTVPMTDEPDAPGVGGSSLSPAGSGGGAGTGDGGRGGALLGYGSGGGGRAASVDRARRGAPGGLSGFRSPNASGSRGGVVLLRAATMSGAGTISADGGDGASAGFAAGGGGGGGGGGTVIVSAPSASGSSLTVHARGGDGGSAEFGAGGGGGGGGGAVHLRAGPAVVDVSGGAKGDSGTLVGAEGGAGGVNASFSASAIPGTPLGVGCQPVPLVGAAAETPTIYRAGGQSATWTVSAVNLNGRPAVTGATLTAKLPTGASLGAAPAMVVLAGGATRASVSDPAPGATLPAWGTFDIPSGGSVWVTFTASVSLAAGTYDLPVVLTGNGPDGPISAGQAAGAPTTDDLTVLNPVSPTVLASSVDDRVDGSASVTRFALDNADGILLTTGAFGPSPSASRYLEVTQATGLFPPGPAVLGGASLRAQVRFAAPAAGVAACVYAQVLSNATGAVLATVGSDASPLGCVVGTTQTTFDAAVPAASWSGAQLNDLRVRLIGWVIGGGSLRVDRAGLVATWGGSDQALQATATVDASSGVPAVPVPNRFAGLLAGSRLDLGGSAFPIFFSSLKYAQFVFPAVVPADATVVDGSLELGWWTDSGEIACWYGELRNGSGVIGTFGGSALFPTCRGVGSTRAVDNVTLPTLTASQARDLRVRIYFKSALGITKWVRMDRVALSVSWYRP